MGSNVGHGRHLPVCFEFTTKLLSDWIPLLLPIVQRLHDPVPLHLRNLDVGILHRLDDAIYCQQEIQRHRLQAVDR